MTAGAVAHDVELALPPTSEATQSERALRRVPLEVLGGVGLVTVALFLALGLAALVLLIDGRSPVTAFSASWDGSVSSWERLGVTANRAVPFAIAGLGFLVAFKAGLLNIGAEGQIFVGAAAGGAVALKSGFDGGVVGIAIALIAGAAAGAALSLAAALLYVWRRVSIVLSTLLLNFVGIQIVSYLVRTPSLLQESGVTTGAGDNTSDTGLGSVSRAFAQSDRIGESWHLPRLLEGNQLHAGAILALLVLLGVVILMHGLKLGFHIKVLGASEVAAQHAGIPVRRTILWAMAICGALGGVAGVVIVLGDRYRVLEVISEDYGFIAILAVLLARATPVGTLAAAFLFAALQRGGQVMEASGEAPAAIVLIVQCTIVLLIACGIELERRRRSRSRSKASV